MHHGDIALLSVPLAPTPKTEIDWIVFLCRELFFANTFITGFSTKRRRDLTRWSDLAFPVSSQLLQKAI